MDITTLDSISSAGADRYDQEDILGSGNFGIVYKGKCKESNKTVAIKVVHMVDTSVHEVNIQRKFAHPNICAVLDVFRMSMYISIVMEFIEGITIEDLKCFAVVHPRGIAAVCSQAIDALAFLHDNAIMHRDLSSENVMIDKQGTVKILDLGTATKVGGEQDLEVGNVWVRAPEVWTDTDYNTKVDIWAVGVLCYMMIKDKDFPDYELEEEAMMERAIAKYCPPIPHYLPQCMKEFLSLCVQPNPHARASAQELKGSAFLTHQYASKAYLSKLICAAMASKTGKEQ